MHDEVPERDADLIRAAEAAASWARARRATWATAPASRIATAPAVGLPEEEIPQLEPPEPSREFEVPPASRGFECRRAAGSRRCRRAAGLTCPMRPPNSCTRRHRHPMSSVPEPEHSDVSVGDRIAASVGTSAAGRHPGRRAGGWSGRARRRCVLRWPVRLAILAGRDAREANDDDDDADAENFSRSRASSRTRTGCRSESHWKCEGNDHARRRAGDGRRQTARRHAGDGQRF